MRLTTGRTAPISQASPRYTNVQCSQASGAFVKQLPALPAEGMTQAYLKSVMHYDPATGLFTWLVRLARVNVGDVAGRAHPTKKAWRICIGKRDYSAHRLAWLYVHGAWPAQQIDHKNGDPQDNRIANLREATPAQNMQNLSRSKTNTSGVAGVRKHKKGWQARICVDRIVHHIGTFSTLEEAQAAHAAAKAVLHPFNPQARAA